MASANFDQTDLDLSLCAKEPIRTPGSIQPHGFLLSLSQDGRVVQVSDNIETLLGKQVDKVLDQPLSAALGEEANRQVHAVLAKHALGEKPACFGTITTESGSHYDVLAHVHEGLTILEFEPATGSAAGELRLLYQLIGSFVSKLEGMHSVDAMSAIAVTEIKRITQFGRVLVYRFDQEGHGHVIAEACDPGYHSYLHQRFPASDIPRQARELYVANRIRLIPDANYTSSRLVPDHHPVTGAPCDLTFATLRSVSPVHLQYMRNMGTLASMSFSLVVKGKLWGLISCHNADPRFVSFEIRAACEQLAQILALRIESREDGEEYHYRLELRRMLVSMLAKLTQETDFLNSMQGIAPELLRFASASGAAVMFENRIARFGDTPSENEIRNLASWLNSYAHDDVFHTDALQQLYRGGAAIARNASGILAVPISRIHNHYLIWFRPEVIHTIDWAGNPHLKANQAEPAGMLTPRKSFEIWHETVRGTSLPWRSSELETALEFRTALLGIVLERAEQMAELAEELGRANKELEAFSYSVSHDLRAPLRHIVGFSDLLLELESGDGSERRARFLRNIKESARFAGKLVDDLLSFSQMGRASLRPCEIDMNELVVACKDRLCMEIGDRDIAWKIEPLPVIYADPNFLQLAVGNLLSNAVKYTGPREHAVIRVSAEENPDSYVFHVRDNGVGFSMQYVHKLFGVFQRLHRMEDFQGTGIGLANVRRIVERHGGKVWAEGAPDAGAAFSFSIPKQLTLN